MERIIEINEDVKDSLKTNFRDESCVIVYSSEKHVKYINTILAHLNNELERNGLKPKLLGDQISSGEDYLDQFGNLIESCVLGIIVLDGFRPNVLFELGFLKGQKKPVIILICYNARISIKTFFQQYQDSGLSKRKFKSLIEPKIDINRHFSDFSGKHLAYIKLRVRKKNDFHITNVIKNQLTKKRKHILEEIINCKLRQIPKQYHYDFSQLISKLIQYYYYEDIPIQKENLKKIHKKLDKMIKVTKIIFPYEIYKIIAETYLLIAYKNETEVESLEYFIFAQKTINHILENINDADLTAYYCVKLGDIVIKIEENQSSLTN